MIDSFLAALQQFADPPIQRILWRVALWTAAIYLVLAVALGTLPFGFDPEASVAGIETEWLRGALSWLLAAFVDVLMFLVFLSLLWILFVAVVQLVSSFYFEEIIRSVEARHFPSLPPPRETTIANSVSAALLFAGRVVLVNFLALPLYLIPGLSIFVFLALNGYLIGREYYEITALRRLDIKTARALRRSQRLRIYGAGIAITALLSVPVINLLAPVIGVAFMVHIFEALPERRAMVTKTAA